MLKYYLITKVFTKCREKFSPAFYLKCAIPAPITFVLVYSKQLAVNNCSLPKLMMDGFEHGSSGVGDDHSVNCSTTTILPCYFVMRSKRPCNL